MSDYASLLRETEEAIGAGQEAHRQAQQVLDSLRSARGWGIYDLLGGGMLSGLMKHSRMDRAQQQLADLGRALKPRRSCPASGVWPIWCGTGSSAIGRY